MRCCTSIKDLGCIYSCDILQIGEVTPTTGNYTIELMPDGVRVLTTAQTGGAAMFFPGGYLNEDGTSIFKIIKPDGTYYETADGEDCFEVKIRPATTAQTANNTVEPVECDDAIAVLKNTLNTTLSTTSIDSGATQNITAPNGTAVLKNTDNDTLSSTPVPSGASVNITAPDATAVLKNTLSTTILTELIAAGDSENITIPNVAWTDSDGSAESSAYGTTITCTAQIKDLELFFAFTAGTDTSALATNSGTTWTLTALAQDGGSGTITVSVNGAAYAAFSNPTTITNGQTLQVKRTSSGSAGSVTITGTYA